MKFIFTNKKGVFYWFSISSKRIKNWIVEREVAKMIGYAILDQIENGEIKVKIVKGGK